MIDNFYINDYVTYAKSGSMTADGTYVFSGSIDLSGKCRIEPVTDANGKSTHRVFLPSVAVGDIDTIFIDGDPYEVAGINNFFDHHIEMDVNVIYP